MKSLDKFAGLEIKNTEEVKGGTFGLLSGLFGGCGYTQPKTCYTPPVNNCYTPPKTIVTLLHKTLVETVVTNSQHLLLVLLSQITAIQDLAGISVLALDVDNCTFSTNK
ncbi:MAG: hypothetical protein IPH28_12145 [Cytophagaceae bacterium]|nr:hypothetical protein [Cytophagaceae bacterium]